MLDFRSVYCHVGVFLGCHFYPFCEKESSVKRKKFISKAASNPHRHRPKRSLTLKEFGKPVLCVAWQPWTDTVVFVVLVYSVNIPRLPNTW